MPCELANTSITTSPHRLTACPDIVAVIVLRDLGDNSDLSRPMYEHRWRLAAIVQEL